MDGGMDVAVTETVDALVLVCANRAVKGEASILFGNKHTNRKKERFLKCRSHSSCSQKGIRRYDRSPKRR